MLIRKHTGWLVMIAIAGILLMATLSQFQFAILKRPIDMQWNGVSLPIPPGTRLIAWPSLSPYYLLSILKDSELVAVESVGGVVQLPDKSSQIYFLTGQTEGALAKWEGDSTSDAFPGIASKLIRSNKGSLKLKCFAGRSSVIRMNRHRFHVVINMVGYTDSLGFVGYADDLKMFIVVAQSALRILGLSDEVGGALESCVYEAQSSMDSRPN